MTKEILKIAEEDSLWTIPIGPKSRFCETFSQQTFFNQSHKATNNTHYNEFEICDSDLKYSSLSTIYASVFFMLLSKVIYGCLYENKEKLDDYEDGYVNTLIPNSNINMMRFIVSGAFYALFNGFNIFVDAEIEYASGVDPRIRYFFFNILYCYYFDKVVINGVDRPISVKDMDEQERLSLIHI